MTRLDEVTTAELIARRLGDDGTVWTAPDGRPVEDVLREEAARVDRDQGPSGTRTRYVFEDGSAITCAGDAWDVGFADCYCWAGAGEHDVDCDAVRS